MGERLALPPIKGASENGFMKLLNPRMLSAKRRGLTIEAHPDDAALGNGLIEELIYRGVGITNLTLTQGGARKISGMSEKTIIEARKVESVDALEESGVALAIHAGLPDGRLLEYTEDGIQVVRTVAEMVDPEFIFVTSNRDKHVDHISAAEIAVAALGNEIPVYMTSSESGRDREGGDLLVTHRFTVSEAAVARRNTALNKHITQMTNLSPEDQMNADNVVFLPNMLGEEHDVPFAAVLTNLNPELGDPVGELLSEILIYQARYPVGAYVGR